MPVCNPAAQGSNSYFTVDVCKRDAQGLLSRFQVVAASIGILHPGSEQELDYGTPFEKQSSATAHVTSLHSLLVQAFGWIVNRLSESKLTTSGGDKCATT